MPRTNPTTREGGADDDDKQQRPPQPHAVTGFTNAEPKDMEGKYVHPEAVRLFAAFPCLRYIPVFGEAVEGFGWQIVVSLGGCYLMCKGISDYVVYNQTYAMLVTRYGIDIPRYQRLNSISIMGWSIKAFTAMLCDGFAFLGYTKRWYMFASCVGGAAFSLIYGLLPAKESSADTACAFIFLCSWGKANVDILSEGHYSRLMRANPKAGPALISWIWVWIMVGAMVSTVLNGPLADLGKPQIAIFIATALQFLTAFFFLFNMYGEKKNRVQRSEDALYMLEETRRERERLGLETADANANAPTHVKRLSSDHSSSDEAARAVQNALNDDLVHQGELVQHEADDGEENNAEAEAEVYYGEPPVPCVFGIFEMNKEVIADNWRIFAYSLVMTCGVVAMLCANIMLDTLGLLVVCVIVSTICCSGSFWALPMVIAKANVFAYLSSVVYIRAGGPLQAFYLNTNGCPGDYPNFSFTFYSTVGGAIGNIAGIVGVTLFNYLFSKCNYQVTFMVTTCMQVLASAFDIIMVKRWNKDIGIPDHAMYLWGDAVVQNVVHMLGFMPFIILISRLCPRGSESVVYALMAGFSNLGGTTASSLGAIIMEFGWPIFSKANGDACNHDNLPIMLFSCGILVPLLVIPMSYMLPRARVIDDIDIDGKVVRKQVDAKANREAVTELGDA